ncbi:hypothetical protein VTJ04DRAFT_3654 [Mycothermus thermophilus]|uniref:uncharacterized protein n=1 Tax=Humicola insolens TaxID=85995 RepID=UPI0037448B2E
MMPVEVGIPGGILFFFFCVPVDSGLQWPAAFLYVFFPDQVHGGLCHGLEMGRRERRIVEHGGARGGLGISGWIQDGLNVIMRIYVSIV